MEMFSSLRGLTNILQTFFLFFKSTQPPTVYIYICSFFDNGATAPRGPRPPHCRGFVITPKHTTVGRTPLDEGSARRRDLYLTTHNTHNRQTSMPLVGFEPAIPPSVRSQTHALNRAATGTGIYTVYIYIYIYIYFLFVKHVFVKKCFFTCFLKLLKFCWFLFIWLAGILSFVTTFCITILQFCNYILYYHLTVL